MLQELQEVRLVVELLNRGHVVKAIVRSPEKLPSFIREHDAFKMIQGSVLELDNKAIAKHVKGCDAVASCLGHNLSLKGIYGHPRKLVTDTTQELCESIMASFSEYPIKFVLMNTAGNRNPDRNEEVSVGQKCVLGLLRLALPPVVDNENAAEYLRTTIGKKQSSNRMVGCKAR